MREDCVHNQFLHSKISSLDSAGNSTLSPQVLDKELKDLSTLVNQELECVNQIIFSQPQEVPAQLLKALEKDAKNLQKSLNSVSDSWSSRLLYLQNTVEVKKVVSCFYSQRLIKSGQVWRFS